MTSERKIRVLQTIRQGKIGGGESHVLDLVGSMNTERYEPVVLSFTGGPMMDRLEKMGVPAYVLQSEKAFDLSVWKRVKRFLRLQKIDVVHIHGTRACTNVMWAARSLGLPVVYTIHGWSFHNDLSPLARNARIAVESFITKCAHTNICVSDSNQETGRNTIRRFRSVVIKNGVNRERFDPQAQYPDIRTHYGIPAENIVVGYIARMTHQKDPLAMLNAFALALLEVQDITLLMIGEGELQEAAKALAKELGIAHAVVFDNFRTDVPAVLNGIDIYCLPSLWEGFPIGVLEAMAMGKAVIASDVDGTREAVTHGVNGLLVPAKDPQAVAACIANLVRDPEKRVILQQHAVEKVAREHDIAKMTRSIETVYDNLYF
jgi:glycosyltransferase involved in cell wall biosynthesis